ncbi:MAG: membrane protein insertase YidC [Microbacterium sp.]|uniref:YidC/Oxa1 family membrane protein insertase n=1 Tax=Microbacterium sp. TaxID=51671 RepID=UPI001AC76CC4|nr:membrane protein insertase YidC [Microbacterium sp.]MBN9177831.1 membrane protein insertase YidC [Microbacterium sp.]
MDLTTLPVLSTLLDLAYTGLMALITLFTPATGALSAAIAVVLVTLIVRAALIPAGIAQAKAEQTRARLAPRLRELQKRHRGDRERLQRETMELYRAEGASPFAGCLPILLQAPIVGLLYSVFLHPMIGGHANELLTQTLFGVPLGTSLFGAVRAGSADPMTWIVIGCLVLAIALVGELTRRLFRPAPSDSPGASGIAAPPAGLLGVLQFATAVVALFVPLAAGLYLLTTVTWTLVQRLVLRRRYPAPA